MNNTASPVENRRCSAMARRATFAGVSACKRKATVARDGRPYCASHDPERVKARREAASKRLENEIATRIAYGERRQHMLATWDGLRDALRAIVDGHTIGGSLMQQARNALRKADNS